MKNCTNFSSSQKTNLSKEIDSICLILKQLDHEHNINSTLLNCQRPCCQFQNTPSPTQTKAKILINLKQCAKRSLHYKTEVTDEYFNRYYNNENFDMSRVYSLTKTKTEEMETLEKTYNRNKGNKASAKRNQKRCQSLYENF